ncbi:polysaccharide pyruvyl transferase CsaB [Paenibacillus sediminis]|uniref:Polysaccharide pyruvyl transferase CsaB n=1 Tax=Paenibacillus sediminis TaxID=664909 RepID=A0ABS4H2E2_9BACL|nr:polysaccharide pyruvyl transferase CsaB [Paenibacillus sediminis]MBP1936683.1 polysaccharide pyruvyl transferase CsaB [Paenibacillus sediminis]
MVSTTSQTIVISGYYGFKNSGDEAVLKSILTALEEQGRQAGVKVEPIVLSIDPEWTSSVYGVRAVHRMKLGEVRQALKESDGLISGGGSLLQDVTSAKTIPYYLAILKLAQWMRKPTFIYAQGIGPVNRKLFHPLIKSVFKKCAYISVRDEQSAELLHSMGLDPKKVQVVPDPVMGLPLPENDRSHTAADDDLPRIGISVRFWNKERRELDSIAQGLKQLAERRNVHLRFLPFHLPADEEASRYIMDKIQEVESSGSKVSICQDALHPQEMLREVSQCQAVIGMRLHSLIYAASRQVPLLGISYDPKIDHFLHRIDSKPVGTTEQLSGGAIATELEKLLEHGDDWRTAHEDSIARLKREAQLPAEHIIDYLRKG